VKIPWAKLIFNELGLVSTMRCHVCTKIEKKEKNLLVKWDSIMKHVGKRKVSNGKWIMDPKCMHIQNEISYAQLFTTTTTILQELNNGQAIEDKQTLVQFVTIFRLLNKHKPMTNHKNF
jgi:hypothetical protein